MNKITLYFNIKIIKYQQTKKYDGYSLQYQSSYQWLLNNLNISSCASLRSLQTESAKERLGLGYGQIRLGC